MTDDHDDLRWMLECEPIDECPFAGSFETVEEALDRLGITYTPPADAGHQTFRGTVLLPLEEIIRVQGGEDASS